MRTPITIPETTKHKYLGGMAALNLPSDNGTGDWHMEQTFFRPRKKFSRSFISGANCATNTNHLLGDDGIYDCAELLKAMNVPFQGITAYAANHARATADLVLVSIMNNESPDHVVLDDWMPKLKHKQAVFDLLSKASSHLTQSQQQALSAWLAKNHE